MSFGDIRDLTGESLIKGLGVKKAVLVHLGVFWTQKVPAGALAVPFGVLS